MVASSPFDVSQLFDHPDPYPFFRELRTTAPVAEIQFLSRPGFVVSKYDDCHTVLKDAETFSSRANSVTGAVMGRTLIEMDGKEHTRHRALVQAVFVPKGMAQLEPILAEMVHELVDGLVGRTSADLVADFTEHFPVQVMAHLIGIPRRDYQQFQSWAIDIIGFARDWDRGISSAEALRQYLLPVIRTRRAEPTEDVISKLVTGKVDGEGLTDDEVVSFLRLLIPAGAETTFKLIGNLFVALLSDRERYERVAADRSLIPWAIEETLRWESSVLMVARETTRPTTLRGVDIPADQLVTVLTSSGNRDEDHYANPDDFDLDRKADDHLAFGFARHHCLGYHLAKMETRLALGAFLDKLPALRLDPSQPAPTITGLAFRSPKTLPVTIR